MKKISVLIIFAVFVLLFVSCALSETESVKSFYAYVSDVQQNYIMVTPLEGSDELRSSDLFTVDVSYLGGIDISEGDTLLITYKGGILETYPAQFSEIVSVEISNG